MTPNDDPFAAFAQHCPTGPVDDHAWEDLRRTVADEDLARVLLHQLGSSARALAWLDAPCPALDQRRPRDALATDRRALRDLLLRFP